MALHDVEIVADGVPEDEPELAGEHGEGCVAIGVGEDVEPHLLLGLDLTAQRSDRSEVPR